MTESVRTVAGTVEATLRRVMGCPINLRGASRTDTGVHARGQVAMFDAADRIPIERLAMAINSRLPEDVEVVRADHAPADFDVIRDVASKQYRYRIWNADARPLEKRGFVYHCWKELDLERMSDAAGRLVGEHDFAGFAAAAHGRTTTVREIFGCEVERCAREPNEVHVAVRGSGFLYHMVRIIAGTLIDVGRGHFEPGVIDRVLASGDRSQAGLTLPPNGLCLEWIRYRSDLGCEADRPCGAVGFEEEGGGG